MPAAMDDGSGTPVRFEYFVLRVARGKAEGDAPLRGTVERLGTQQKHDFRSSDELLQLLGGIAPDPRLDESPHP